VVALVDAGFSGAGGRSAIAADQKPPATIPAPEAAAHTALFSAVTSAETAGTVPPGAPGAPAGLRGLFTHYLGEGAGRARADIDGDGVISLQELVAWAGPRVMREAKRDGRSQTPALILGAGVAAGQLAIASGLPIQ
jgi:hypothetical protein